MNLSKVKHTRQQFPFSSPFMKFLNVLLCLCAMNTHAWSAGNVSAQAGLRMVDKTTGVKIAPRVVSIMGVKGQNQPLSWLYIIQNAKGQCFEFNVTNGRYLGSRGIPRVDVGKPIPAHRWKIDSTQAFALIDKMARKAKVGFDSVNFHLRCAELSDRPVWFLTLLDNQSKAVGLVTLSAENGEVLSKSFPAANVAQQYQQPAAPKPGQTQYYTPRQSANQTQSNPPVSAPPSSTLDGVGQTIARGAAQVGGTVKGWFNKLRGQPSPPAPTPYSGQPVR